MRLIDADQFGVISLQGKSDDFIEGVKYVLEKIDEAPTVETSDVLEMLQKEKKLYREKAKFYREKCHFNTAREIIGFIEVLEHIDEYIRKEGDKE